MVAIAIIYALGTGAMTVFPAHEGDSGLCLPPAEQWNIPGWASLIVNLGLNAFILIMLSVINKTFNVMRAVTWLPVGLYAIMQAAVPRELIRLNSGTLLALAVIVCMYLIFYCYDAPERVRRVFLTFLVISLGAACQYSFIIFIPVFWLICAQMRIFTLRSFIASVLGILTPWIIMLGFGLVHFDDFHAPQIVSVYSALDLRSAMYLLIVTAFTVCVLIFSLSVNLWKTISYNARARAYNGAFTVVSVITLVAMVFDYTNLLTYLPLLNLCAAFQLTHYFVTHRFDRQYAAVMAVCAVYIILYLWRITIQR